jgi:hypothetical protein
MFPEFHDSAASIALEPERQARVIERDSKPLGSVRDRSYRLTG